jgi:hypothetical protein
MGWALLCAGLPSNSIEENTVTHQGETAAGPKSSADHSIISRW